MKSSINLDAKTMREACGHFPSGVVAIAAVCDGTPQVLVASSFSVGVSPWPLCLCRKLLTPGRCCPKPSAWAYLSSAWSMRLLAGSSLPATGKSDFAMSRPRSRQKGRCIWQGRLCALVATYPAGDHDAIHLLIHDLHLEKKTAPLVFHNSRFTQLVAPQMLAVPPATQQLACAAA